MSKKDELSHVTETTFNIKIDGKFGIMKLSGNLSSPMVPAFDKKMEELFEQTKVIILDISNLEYMCSAAIGTMISYFNQATAAGGGIVVTGINRKIKKVFDILGFPSLVRTASTVKAAKEILNEDFLNE